MQIVKLSLLILIIFTYTGCIKKIYIDRDNIIYYKPPKVILDSNITIPKFNISKEKYVLSNPIERENLLSNYIIDLLNTIDKYKIKFKNINTWYKEVNSTVSK